LSLTIVLSGPKAANTQARTALASRGFAVTDNTHDYGLRAEGGEPQEFIHVQGDDIDAAHATVVPLGYRLTLHYETPEESPPSIEQQLRTTLAEYERRIAALEAQAERPPMRGGAVESPAWANQNSTYGAEQTRRAISSLLLRGSSIGSISGGVVGAGDMAITPPGSGMSINIAPGECWVPGTAATQGGYYSRVASTSNLAIAASDPANPRIDRVSAIVTDSAYFGATNTFAVAVETGTPTAGANLANLLGAPGFPDNSVTLGWVLVPAGASSIVSGDISNIATCVTAGISPLSPITTGSTTAQDGQWISATFGSTVTLPTPTPGALIAIGTAGVYSGTPVTVTTTGGALIRGVGLSGTSFVLGTPAAQVILAGTTDGAWEIISGQQDTGWVTLPLINSATATAGWHTPVYRIRGDRVELEGNVTTSGSSIGAQLPAGARPSVQVELVGWASVANTAKKVIIDTSGNINMSLAGDSISLDGLWFSLS